MSLFAQDGHNAQEHPDCSTFEAFGRSQFFPENYFPLRFNLISSDRNILLRAIRSQASTRPGVYMMKDQRNRVIYVGKAKSIRARLHSYFRTYKQNSKPSHILDNTHSLCWEYAHDEFGALLRELELIRRHRPRFNVVGQPGKRNHCYLILGCKPAAFFFVTDRPTRKEILRYGPFTSKERLNDVARCLNDYFRLRDCEKNRSIRFADQRQIVTDTVHVRCMRVETRSCLAPCIGSCYQNEYTDAVSKARQFLETEDNTPIDQLTNRMQDASNQCNYELATSIRDRLLPMRWIKERVRLLQRQRSRVTFIYAPKSHRSDNIWYIISGGIVVHVMSEPRNKKELIRARDLITATAKQQKYGSLTIDSVVDSILLVNAWFKRNPCEQIDLHRATLLLGNVASQHRNDSLAG